MSKLKLSVLDLKTNSAATIDELTALHTLIFYACDELESNRPNEESNSFGELDLFIKLHAWIEANLTVFMDSNPGVPICEDVPRLLLDCMNDSTKCLILCFGGSENDLRDSLRDTADKVIKHKTEKEKKVWVGLLGDLVKGLAGLFDITSKIMVQVRGRFRLDDHVLYEEFVLYQPLKKICQLLSYIGYLGKDGSYIRLFNNLPPLVSSSVQSILIQTCCALEDHFDSDFIIGVIRNMDDADKEEFCPHFQAALEMFGDLITYLIEHRQSRNNLRHKELQAERLSLFQVLRKSLRCLARLSRFAEVVNASFLHVWLKLLIEECPLLSFQDVNSNNFPLKDEVAHVALLTLSINFNDKRVPESQTEQVLDLWGAAAGFLLKEGRPLLKNQSAAVRARSIPMIEIHLRYLGKYQTSAINKISGGGSFVSLGKLSTCLGVSLTSADLDPATARYVCSLLVTMRKVSLCLLDALDPDASHSSFKTSLLIHEAMWTTLFSFNRSIKMGEFITGMDHAPLIHLLPALNASSVKVWLLGDKELRRIETLLPKSEDHRKQHETLSNDVRKSLIDSMSETFDTLASSCLRILDFARTELFEATPPSLFAEESEKDEEAPCASNREAAPPIRPRMNTQPIHISMESDDDDSEEEEMNEVGEEEEEREDGWTMRGRPLGEATEEEEEWEEALEVESQIASHLPDLLFFPIAIIYASGVGFDARCRVPGMLTKAAAHLSTMLKFESVEETVKIELIEPVSRALGLLLDLASTLTMQSRFLSRHKSPQDVYILLHISLAADLTDSVLQSGLIEAISSSPLVESGKGQGILIHLLAGIMKCLSSCSKDVGSILHRYSLSPQLSSELATLLLSSSNASRQMAISIYGFKRAMARSTSKVESPSSFVLDSIRSAHDLGGSFKALMDLLLCQLLQSNVCDDLNDLILQVDELKERRYRDWGKSTHLFDADRDPLCFCSNLYCRNFDASELELQKFVVENPNGLFQHCWRCKKTYY